MLRHQPVPALQWSGQRDSIPRPSAPKADALPDCAMPRPFPASDRLPGHPGRRIIRKERTSDQRFGAAPLPPSRPTPSGCAVGLIFKYDPGLRELLADPVRLVEVAGRPRGAPLVDQPLDVGVGERYIPTRRGRAVAARRLAGLALA